MILNSVATVELISYSRVSIHLNVIVKIINPYYLIKEKLTRRYFTYLHFFFFVFNLNLVHLVYVKLESSNIYLI